MLSGQKYYYFWAATTEEMEPAGASLAAASLAANVWLLLEASSAQMKSEGYL